MNGSWDAYLRIWHPPKIFAGENDVMTNLAEREPGIEIIERSPQSLIITSLVSLISPRGLNTLTFK